MPRTSSSWSVNDDMSATRMNAINTDLTDLYTYGSDRGRIQPAISGTPLRIDIGAFAWLVGDTSGQYAGGTNIVVTNTATNYVEIDSTNTININTSGWTATSGRLGTVTCAGGVITAISIWRPDVVGGDMGGSKLVNVEALSGTRTLITTDKFHQVLDPNGATRTVTLDTSGMVEGSEFHIKNNSSGPYSLIVKQSTTVLTVIAAGAFCEAVFDGTNWKIIFDTISADYGDGSDGDVTISSNTTLTSDKQYNNLTINAGIILNSDGYLVRVKNVTTFGDASSKIALNGGTGSNGSNALTSFPSTGGAGGAGAAGVGTGGSVPTSKAGVAGQTGGDGGANTPNPGGPGGNSAGIAGVAETNGIGVTSVAGAAGGSGGNGGGAVGTSSGGALATTSISPAAIFDILSRRPIVGASHTINGGASSGGAGGGGGGSGNFFNTLRGGGGGGGGGSGSNGGNIWFASRVITGAGFIQAKGGTGGSGGNGYDGEGVQAGRGGGGAGGTGGTGGTIICIYEDKSGWSAGTQLDVSGGTGGAAGTAASGTGVGGVNGSAGTTGATGTALALYRPYLC